MQTWRPSGAAAKYVILANEYFLNIYLDFPIKGLLKDYNNRNIIFVVLISSPKSSYSIGR